MANKVTPKTSIEWGDDYRKIFPSFTSYTHKLKQLLVDILKHNKLEFFEIECRTKEIQSFINKIESKEEKYKNPISEITDLSGIRIIAYYLDDVEKIGEIIKKEFIVDDKNTIYKSKELNPDQFGYISDQYIVNINAERSKLTEWVSFKKLKAEIQVRTVLQHAWSAIDHKLRYKSAIEAPKELQRKLFRLSALLELTDEEFLNIRNKSDEIEKDYDKSINEGKLGIEINRESLISYFKKNKIQTKWTETAEKIGFAPRNELSPEARKLLFIDSKTSFFITLDLLNIVTIEELDKILTEANKWGEEILGKYLEFRKKGTIRTIIATPYSILIILILYAKREMVNDEIINLSIEGSHRKEAFEKLLKYCIK